ncbi:MAG TPA: CsgG/HfaB family protein [Gemmatimonadales bacterium]|jgi:curli biogenesis system outer membrane secretion channel CsgG
MTRLTLTLCLAALTAPALDSQQASAPTPAPAPAPTPAARRRVAVLDFDYAAVRGYVNNIWASDVDLGKGVATMLVSELAQNGTYTVMERAQLDRVLSEQNFQQGERTDASSAARLGRLLGVDAIIIGSITQFQREDKNINLGMRRESKATVAIDARIVQIGTGEILGVAQGKGESKRAHFTSEEEDRARDIGGHDMWSSNLASTILGEATRKAVTNLVTTLAAAAPKIPENETVIVISGLVADVSGSELVINVGTARGVKVGAEYAVLRPGREIKDPATGALLRRTTTPVGKIKVTAADELSATGTLTGDPARVGDCVGACPLAPAAAPPPPPPQQQASAQAAPSAPAPPAPSSENGRALPALYTGAVSGPFTWKAYSFKGTEHFRYDAMVNIGGQPRSGFYELDAAPAGGGRISLRVQGRMGKDAFSSTTTLGPDEAFPPEQMAQLGPAAVALFGGYSGLFMGRQWAVGEGWSSSYGGQSMSFKAESTCQYAGVQGLRGVMRQNDRIMMDMCVSPNVGLPLAVTMDYGSGAMSYSYAVKLTQFRP